MLFRANNKSDAENLSQSNKVLKRLKRQDLLELLLEQMAENETLNTSLDQQKKMTSSLEDQVERLNTKLDERDSLVELLNRRLELKDKMIASLLGQGNQIPGSLVREDEALAYEQRTNYNVRSTYGATTYGASTYGATSTTGRRLRVDPASIPSLEGVDDD